MIGGSRLHITHALAEEMRADFARPHEIAAERVGIVRVRYASPSARHVIVVVGYESAPDDAYVRGRAAANFDVRWLMQRADAAAAERCGVMWVHLHEHKGEPRFSSIDLKTSRGICPALALACPRFPQGALVLSADAAAAHVVTVDSLSPIDIAREVGRYYEIAKTVPSSRG
jgi:hypothetical protein